MAGTIFTGCESSEEKVENAKADVKDAKQNLTKEINAEEWRVFKTEAEAKIKFNEGRIVKLKEKQKSSGKTMDALYLTKIEALEQRNRDLRTKINTYDMSQSNWESFKREFNHDMEAFGKAFKDLGVDNKI